RARRRAGLRPCAQTLPRGFIERNKTRARRALRHGGRLPHRGCLIWSSMPMAERNERRWALILGASSGFGEATARELARRGFDVCGVHLDRRAGMAHVEEIASAIRGEGREAVFFNVNAADHDKRHLVLDALAARVRDDGGGTVGVLMHSIAFGSLSPLVGQGPGVTTAAQLTMTLDVMAHSLVYWT